MLPFGVGTEMSLQGSSAVRLPIDSRRVAKCVQSDGPSSTSAAVCGCALQSEGAQSTINVWAFSKQTTLFKI